MIRSSTLMKPIVLMLALVFNFTIDLSAQRNVLILYPEDMGNHLSILGTPGIQTPNIDEFAKEGVQFIANFCAQPVCSPSKSTLYTGLYPHKNGMILNVPNHRIRDLPIPEDEDPSIATHPAIKDEVPTLIEILNEAGYFTAVTSKTHVQPMRKFRFDFGWGEIGSPGIYEPKSWKDLIAAVTSRSNHAPFFILANTSLTHAPWQRKLVDNDISSNPDDRLAHPTSVNWAEIPIHPFLPDTERSRKDLARYFATVQLVDDWVKVLLDELDAQGLADSTLVIFTPDHGMPYQRGKVACYPAGTQVPLIIRGPGVAKDARIEAPVTHADLLATVLEFLRIDAPAVQHGKSLWPMLSGKQRRFIDRKTILTETNSWYKARAVTDGRWYYVRNYTQPESRVTTDDSWSNPPMNIDLWMPDHKTYDNQVYSETIRVKDTYPLAYELLAQIVEGRLPQEELYDLRKDPWATNNLLLKKKKKGVLKEMRLELQQWQSQTDDPLGM